MGVIDLVDSIAAGILFFLVIGVLVQIVLHIPAYWCLRRAGWSGWWFIVLAIPVLGLIVLWWFAFGRWPKEFSEDQG